MAVTSHADLAGMMAASATIAATIVGIQHVYDKAGEIPADAIDLPAILQNATAPDLPPATIERITSQQAVVHHWYLDVLVKRTGDLYTEQAAAFPFIPLVLEKFRANIALGYPLYVAECQPQNYRFVITTHSDQSFFTVRFLMRCRGKAAVSYTDAA